MKPTDPNSEFLIRVAFSDDASNQAFMNNISNLSGLKNSEEHNTEPGTRGGGIDILSVIVVGFAIPAFLKAVEVFLLTRKVEVELEIPNKNTKLKISGLSKDDLEEKISSLSSLLKEGPSNG